jgi:drug/metabolite transporter (DMT)-like permease
MIATDSRGAALAAGALVVNAFVWGLSWWPLRQLHGLGWHPLWATGCVYLLVLGGLLMFHANGLRSFRAHPQLWLLALASGLTNVGFNWAVTVGDVVRVVLLFYLMPAWAVLVAWAVLGERPTRGALFRLAVAMSGVLIVLKTPASPWPIPQSLPDWLALMGGFSFALTNVMLSKLSHTPSASRMLAMFGGGAAMAIGVAVWGMSYEVVSTPVWVPQAGLWILGLALAFLASNTALQYGAARLIATTTSLVMLTEIIFASLSSALFGAAEFTSRIFLGGSLIVIAALLAARAQSQGH